MMKKTLIITLCILAGLVLAGCNSAQPAVEVVSPTGCLKSQGRYYDPKLKDCVKVTNDQQAFVLDYYRYVNKLAEEGKYQEVEYRINFETYMPLDKVESFWTELRSNGAKMLLFSGDLPDDYGYDIPPGDPSPPGPKTWGSPSAANVGGCGWHHSFEAAPEENTIRGMLLQSIKAMETDVHSYGGARPRPELRKAILEDGDCGIYSMSVMANPVVMRDFWNRHLDDIRGIQPQITTLDKIMHTRLLGPIEPVTQQLGR